MNLDSLIRVDHAGEYGAKRIYQGQLDVLRRKGASKETIAAVEEMAAEEVPHLEKFEALITEHKIRPTALFPLWHVAGYALGAATAAMGEKAAMACTVAVEETIGQHYAKQVKALEGQPEHSQLKETLTQFRDEELEHHDTGIAHGGTEIKGYSLLKGLIQQGSRTAIWLSERV